MGIPKFFRWISERYPCLNELVAEHQIPEFDNLYLDMNGIIHVCSHPNDFDVHFRISEERIFKDIFAYIETLFCIIQPKRLFFMAVDGVAPRAKMNQQRGRRFRSAKEAETMEEAARKKGEELPTESRFDSNCITPGTEFMVKLQEQLKYFVAYKMSNDKLWQKPRIVLSGHETPGEGEHKIMDYIRYLKSDPGYSPVTRHCLYGLDADLIMLGLCSHEPYFSLLREEVKFGKKNQKRMSSPAETKFFLLHLSLMREYLELEFAALKQKINFEFDLDAVINDWVLMCFLVGNDFIPPLPGLHISSGALPVLYNAYMDVMPKLDGYINEYGVLNVARFQAFMERLAEFDREQFKDTFADLKYFEGKTGRRPESNNGTTTRNSELDALIKATDDVFLEGSDEEDDNELFGFDENCDEGEQLMQLEFSQHKKDYYRNKLEYQQVTPEVLKEQAEGYVLAIQWNLNYYYHGVCSWSWFYPHHYAPFISDIRNFADIKLDFELGKPFLPFQQLLAVLPAASKALLPRAYHGLMESSTSPIIHYYPTDFSTDLNGKKQEWEALVLIPFIDQHELLSAMATCESQLTASEVSRNTHGPMFQYDYQPVDLGVYPATAFFPPISNNRARVTPVDRNDILVERSKLVKGLCPAYKKELFIPGFPTLRHIPHTASLKMAKVRVFERASMSESLVLEFLAQDRWEMSLTEVAENLLGKIVYVSYPHLLEARVVSVCNKRMKFLQDASGYKMEEHNDNNFTPDKRNINEHYSVRLGIDMGEISTVVYAHTMTGRKYVFTPQGKVTLEKQWSATPSAFALQTIVEDVLTPTPEYTQYDSVHDIFTPDSQCFLLNKTHYGAPCKVVSCDKLKASVIGVEVSEILEPPFTPILKNIEAVHTRFMSSAQAAQYSGMSPQMFSSITGAIYISTNQNDDTKKTNIGLNLKFNAKNEEVPGYTKKPESWWLYSEKTIELVDDYADRFPQLFQNLRKACQGGRGNFTQQDLFPENSEDRLQDVVTWLREQPCSKLERQKCGTSVLEAEQVAMLEDSLVRWQKPKTVKTSRLQVPATDLYKPGLLFGNLVPDCDATYNLFDRVVNVRESFTVPLALQGTVIGVESTQDMIEILFDDEFDGGMVFKCSTPRVFKMAPNALINISYGNRKDQAARPKSAFVRCRNSSSPTKNSKWERGNPFQQQQQPSNNFQNMWDNLKELQSTKPVVNDVEKVQAAPPKTHQRQQNASPSVPQSAPTSVLKKGEPSLDVSTSFLRKALGVAAEAPPPPPPAEASSVHNFFMNARCITPARPPVTVAPDSARLAFLPRQPFPPPPPVLMAFPLKEPPRMPLPPVDIKHQLALCMARLGLGAPGFQVAATPDRRFACRVIVQGVRALDGMIADSKEQAIDNAATRALQVLASETMPAPAQLPQPPQQWFSQQRPTQQPFRQKEVQCHAAVELQGCPLTAFVPHAVLQRGVTMQRTKQQQPTVAVAPAPPAVVVALANPPAELLPVKPPRLQENPPMMPRSRLAIRFPPPP